MGLNKNVNFQNKPFPEKTLDDLDKKMGFGKYSQITMREVIDINPGYLEWLHYNTDSFSMDWELLELVEEALQEDKAYNGHQY